MVGNPSRATASRTHKEHMMSMTARMSRAMSVTGLAAVAVFLPVAAGAADEPPPVNNNNSNKAQVEYSERQAQPSPHPPKAQVEHDETARLVPAPTEVGRASSATDALQGTDDLQGSAVAWQLALSAFGGAALTGVGVAGTRQLRRHHSAVV